jgi:hypothetical protein
VFYDAFDEDGLDDLIGKLSVHWPLPLERDILRADDTELTVAAS